MEGQVSSSFLLSPPLVFIIIMGALLCFALLLSRLSLKITKLPAGMTKAYSCGEELPTHMIQPDYSQFYPFAFYFTILHVVALMAATVPVASLETSLIAIVYILGAIIGLFVLYMG
jgi:hypothetical protein